MQEADGDRLNPVRQELADGDTHLLGIERGDDAPVAVHALADFQAMAARNQRRREGQEQIIDVVALLGAHLERIAKTARGQQAQFRAAPLNDRVGDERGAVDDFGDIGESDVRLCRQRTKPFESGD